MSYYNPFILFNKPTVIVPGSYDVDAQAVIDAIQLTDALTTAQKDAINYRVTQFKIRGTWTKRKAYYGFVGGSANAHKWNWKDPRDMDAAYRLTFIGSPTHDANGVDWNGASQYADTHIIPASVLTLNSTHLSYYSRENTAVEGMDIGSCDPTDIGNKRMIMHIQWSDGNGYYDMYSSSGGRIAAAPGSSLGLFTMSRTASNAFAIYKAGFSIGNMVSGNGALPNCTSNNRSSTSRFIQLHKQTMRGSIGR
jgi:hypothetical protein